MVERDEWLKRQHVLAEFGELCLRSEVLDEILKEGCRLVSVALNTDLAKILELDEQSGTALVRAGVGWKEEVVGRTRIKLDERSSEAYALKTAKPLVTQDIHEETRFDFPAFVQDAGVVALVNVPIILPGGKAFGLLQVDARERREFGDEDIQFLRTYAMVLGPVIDRLKKARELKQTAERFRLIVESARDYAIFLTDENDIVTDWLPGAAKVFGWAEDEIVGQPASILFTPEDRANGVPQHEFEQARAGGKAPNVRWHLRKDNSRVFIEGQVIALRRDDGGLRGIMKIGQDVTNRRRDEERQSVLLAELQH